MDLIGRNGVEGSVGHADKIFEHEQKGSHGYDVQSITRRLDNAGFRNMHIDLNELLFMT